MSPLNARRGRYDCGWSRRCCRLCVTRGGEAAVGVAVVTAASRRSSPSSSRFCLAFGAAGFGVPVTGAGATGVPVLG